jgi:uncharacterized protein (TIGR02421 family)
MKIKEAHWAKIDQEYLDLQGDIDIDNYLAPINRAAELGKFKEAVSNGKTYNPQFEYDPLPEVRAHDLETFKSTLEASDPIDAIFISAIDFRLGEIQAAMTHDPSWISKNTIAMFGQPDDQILEAAKQNLNKYRGDQTAYHGKSEGKTYDAEELAGICREAMKSYGFDWKVVVKPEMGVKAAVDNLIREFWIRADVKFHESLVKMMVVHEIGTHVLRSENGYAQPLKLFGRGLPAYQYTEEGLAEYAEQKCGALLDDTVYRISGRVIGVRAALNGSFWDTYQSIKDYFDVDMAFDIAQRAKQGLRDTSEKGAYTKDYTYLSGLLFMRRFFQEASPADIDALFAGKVGYQHLDTVRKLQHAGYLLRPKVYPEWM